MNNTPSLDDVLKDIERESIPVPPMKSSGVMEGPVQHQASIGMQDVSAHLTLSGSDLLQQEVTPPAPTQHSGAELWESNLTQRQRALPKLPLKMLGGVAALFIMVVGLGSATFLSQQNQDLRQQAYVDTLPDLAGESAVVTQQEQEQMQQAEMMETEGKTTTTAQQMLPAESPVSNIFLAGLVLGGLTLVILAVVVWIFV